MSRERMLVRSADLVSDTEGNMVSRITASAASAPRGQWPWHTQTLLAREPGDLSTGRRLWRAAVRIGEAEEVAADDVRAAEGARIDAEGPRVTSGHGRP